MEIINELADSPNLIIQVTIEGKINEDGGIHQSKTLEQFMEKSKDVTFDDTKEPIKEEPKLKYTQLYYLRNKEKKLAYQREYSKTHTKKIKEYKEKKSPELKIYKQNYLKRKVNDPEELNRTVTCICGSVFKPLSYYAHLRSDKHINNMKIKNEDQKEK